MFIILIEEKEVLCCLDSRISQSTLSNRVIIIQDVLLCLLKRLLMFIALIEEKEVLCCLDSRISQFSVQ